MLAPFSSSLLICLPLSFSLLQWTCAPVHHEGPQASTFLPWDLSPQEEARCEVRLGGIGGEKLSPGQWTPGSTTGPCVSLDPLEPVAGVL